MPTPPSSSPPPAGARARGRLRARCAGLVALLLLAAITSASGDAAAPASLRIEGAAPGDRAGTSIAPAGDYNGDGHADLIIGAPGALANANGTARGAAYVLFGPFPLGSTIDLANLQGHGVVLRGSPAPGGETAGQSAAATGQSVAAAGDVNGDGLDDVIVGAPGATPDGEGPQIQRGRAYVVFGTRAPHDLDLAALSSSGIALTGARFHFPDAFGWQVAGVGDVDRDGLADVAVAAPGNPGFENESTPGSGYVVFGRRTAGAVSVTHLGSRGFRIGTGPVTAIAAAGDWDRDRRADIAVFTGRAVHVVYGHRYRRAIDVRRLGARGVTIRSAAPRSLESAALAGGPDVNGDGRPDLVIGAPQSHYFGLGPANGGAWIVPGTPSRRTIQLSAGGRAAWEAAIGARGWLAGSAMALGRVNDDSRADTVLIAHGDLAVLYGGPARRRVRLDALPAARGFVVDGTGEPAAPGSPAGVGGFAAVAVTDLNGDHHAELLAGAPFAAPESRAGAGAAVVFFVR